MEAQVWDGECVVTEGDALDSENNAASASPQDAQTDIPECGAGEVPGGSSPAQVKLETQEPSVIVPVAVSGGGLQAQVKLETQEASQNSLLAQNAPLPDSRAQTEEFIIFDQNGQPLQYERMVILTGQSENGQLYVIPSNHFGGAQVLLPQGQLMDIGETAGPCVEKSSTEHAQTITLTAITDPASGSTVLTSPPVTQSKAEPHSWAHLLHSCEKIGDSYRGFCTNEAELEAVLMLHKQHTHSVFGTRQSPSPAKPATRLMWKSQYVPYDGIPFVNAGSRAIVMECQFGPRRKGLQPKKTPEQEISTRAQYKATCPARIYIKKVRKFPEYRVPTDPKVDKKVVRQEQEKAFFNLKKSLWDAGGVLRYYVQLPTQKAHLYHSMDTPVLPSLPAQLLLPKEEEPEEEEEEDEDEEGAGGEGGTGEDGSFVPSRLHPRVAEKIVELVAQGHSQVYAVRKQLRKFVEREMFKSDKVPERHNLCYFPTVNDIKNHIHEAQKQLQPGGAGFEPEGTDAQWAAGSESAFSETVTLTLAPATEATPQRGEALEGSDTLSHEAMQLFSSLTALQPKIFAQLHGVQFQPALPCSSAPPSSCSPPPPREGVSLSDPAPLLGVGQLVSVSALTDGTGEGGVHQILLDDGQAIPVQIVEPVTGAGVSVPEDQSEASELEVSGTDGLHSPKD
ncbi:hypothetical protein ANANG_G00273000 [Anguilla anguilla]|uniref:Calcium-responsive transcription factor n=1 Tax=Anguilla anguilla TaxID=7936 RepID=A0A9D3LPC3_ANGAN|nr:hypothetical protein ANANG_G00273000 [Anguilla anguilla]